MSSAAQSIRRPRLTLSRRAGMRLRQWTLRGTAIVYLGAFIALPVARRHRQGLRRRAHLPEGRRSAPARRAMRSS